MPELLSRFQTMICACGCGKEIFKNYSFYTPKFLRGHNSKGRKNEWSKKPMSLSSRTGHSRARKYLKESCELLGTHCKGPLQVHHKDKNPLNNNSKNLMTLCVAHHRFIERYKNMPSYRVDKSGKRRYVKA